MPVGMSMRFNRLSTLLIVTGLQMFTGCSPSLPSDWQKDIPGIYEGIHSGFREIIEFKPDGTFRHEVWKEDRSIHAESGKWSVVSNQAKFVLQPFTEFYHPIKKTFSLKGDTAALYYYWPVPDGRSFAMISADTEYEYRLGRKDTKGVIH